MKPGPEDLLPSLQHAGRQQQNVTGNEDALRSHSATGCQCPARRSHPCCTCLDHCLTGCERQSGAWMHGRSPDPACRWNPATRWHPPTPSMKGRRVCHPRPPACQKHGADLYPDELQKTCPSGPPQPRPTHCTNCHSCPRWHAAASHGQPAAGQVIPGQSHARNPHPRRGRCRSTRQRSAGG